MGALSTRMLRGVARYALAWWAAELSAMMPDWLNRRLQPARRAVILDPQGDGFVVSIRDRGGERAVATVGSNAAIAGPPEREPADVVERLIQGDAPVRLRVGGQAFLRRDLALPLDVEATAQRAIEFQVDSLTPFKREDVYVGYRVGRRDFLKGEIRVAVAVVPRQGVDAALDLARRNGLTPGAVEAAADEGPIVVPLATAEVGAGAAGRRRWRGSSILLAGTAALLLAAVVCIPIYRLEQRVDRLKAAIEGARENALATQRLRQKLTGAGEAGRFFAERKAARPLTIELLDEATRRIPDSAWLSDFRVDDGTVYLSGYAANASSLLGEIEASPLFSDTKFLSPVTREGKNNVERFEMSSAVAGRGKP